MSDPTRLCPIRETPDGFTILTCHYSAFPGYDFESACRGMAPEDIATELEISWSSAPGLRVYRAFKYDMHVARQPIRYQPSLPLTIGWDFGLSPACAISQVNALGQWCIFPSFHPEEREFEGIYQFSEVVADHLLRVYAAPHGMSLEELPMTHIGDPAGRSATPQPGQRPNETLSAFQILFRGIEMYAGDDDEGEKIVARKPGWGWRVLPGAVSISDRLEAVKGRLTTLLGDGVPALLVDPREEFIITGFQGGYRYKQFSDGTFDRHPLKDHFSHVFDALGYCATRLFARPSMLRDGETESDRARPEPFRSQASGFHRY